MNYQIAHSATFGKYARKSLLLHLQDARGNCALSEIAPLPYFSSETLLEAEKQLRSHFISPLSTLFPSVYFGISTALLDLTEPLCSINCQSHCLLMGSDILDRAETAHKKGYRVAKVKLGDKSDEEAHRLINALRSLFTLRLDLNRRWTLQRALTFFSCYEKDAFDYIEEPVENPKDLPHFPFPFALDETLRESKHLSLAKLPMCTALILKPTLLGNLRPFLDLHPRCILSSSFEGPVGLGQIAKLVKRYRLLNEFHGLDTLSY